MELHNKEVVSKWGVQQLIEVTASSSQFISFSYTHLATIYSCHHYHDPLLRDTRQERLLNQSIYLGE